jgi:hypothetical protein
VAQHLARRSSKSWFRSRRPYHPPPPAFITRGGGRCEQQHSLPAGLHQKPGGGLTRGRFLIAPPPASRPPIPHTPRRATRHCQLQLWFYILWGCLYLTTSTHN